MITLPVTEIIVGDRHRKVLGDIAGLAKSILEVGLLQAVVVTKDKKLVAGARRLAAVKELGWVEVPVRVVDNLDDALLALRAERDENACRKEFTPSETARLAKTLQDLEKAKAKERQRAGGRAGGKGSGKLSGAEKGDTRGHTVAEVGVSATTLQKIQVVVEAADANPELLPLVEKMDQTGKVDPVHKEVMKKLPPKPKAKKKRPRDYRFLDGDTKKVLGEHAIGYAATHIKALLPVLQRDCRLAVASLLVEGKAKSVKEALAIVEAEAAREQIAPSVDQHKMIQAQVIAAGSEGSAPSPPRIAQFIPGNEAHYILRVIDEHLAEVDVLDDTNPALTVLAEAVKRHLERKDQTPMLALRGAVKTMFGGEAGLLSGVLALLDAMPKEDKIAVSRHVLNWSAEKVLAYDSVK